MGASSENDESAGLLEAADYADHVHGKAPEKAATSKYRPSLFGILFIALIASNILTLVMLLPSRLSTSTAEPPSKYAGLQRTREEPYVMVTKYASENDTLRNQLWYDINIDDGMVALSDDWAAQHDLRTAQRFPWDQSKGIYLLQGFHNLHCMKIIYISMNEYRTGQPQTRSWHHISHCMDALRRQILCDADDTPRATERRAEVVTGVGQHRMCRNWDELVDFAKQHTACYKRPEPPDESPTVDKFKHCPPGSGYVVTDNYVPTDEFMVGLPEESIELD